MVSTQILKNSIQKFLHFAMTDGEGSDSYESSDLKMVCHRRVESAPQLDPFVVHDLSSPKRYSLIYHKNGSFFSNIWLYSLLESGKVLFQVRTHRNVRSGSLKLPEFNFVVSNGGTAFVVVANDKSQRLLAELQFFAPRSNGSKRWATIRLPGVSEANRRLVSLPGRKLGKESFYMESPKNICFGRTERGSSLIIIRKCSEKQFDLWTHIDLDPARIFGIMLANHMALVPKRSVKTGRPLEHMRVTQAWKGIPPMALSVT
jgi:hypothetical protein